MTVLLAKMASTYTYDTLDEISIQSIVKLPITAREMWSHDDFALTYGKIKAFLLAEQKRICFYCQKQLVDITNEDWHIDHVLPIDEDPRHVFTSFNYVLSCKWCNRIKGAKPTMKSFPKTKKYSKNTLNYRIVHPRYDDYSLHIEILGGRFYFGSSDKGQYTKYICNLDRFALNQLVNLKASDRKFVDAALKFLLGDNPRELLDFIDLII